MSSTNEQHIATVRDLEQAVAAILSHNFDADSRECLRTLLKLTDNVLKSPYDAKFRTVRLTNAAIVRKIVDRKGVPFLQAAGFVAQAAAAPLLSSRGQETAPPQVLILPYNDGNDDNNESTTTLSLTRLSTARRLLVTRLVQDLNVKPDELPPWPAAPVVLNNSSANGTHNNNNAVVFDPYVSRRFDGQAAAVGQSTLGPDANYVSPTESELARLQARKQALERKKAAIPSCWRAFRPGEEISAPRNNNTNSNNARSVGRTDAQLIADAHQRQQKALQPRGFTTKAMRDLACIKKAKVYSHVTLTIQFPDGHRLQGQFAPDTTTRTVAQQIATECFVTLQEELELYVTPPRRVLTGTLQQESLVPAAKLYGRFKMNGDYTLRPELFSTHTAPQFPSSQAVVDNSDNDKKKNKPVAVVGQKVTAPVPEVDREEALLRRMMGKKKKLGLKK